MKKFAASLAAIVVIALASAVSAFAWHANGVTVAGVCNTGTGNYDVTATIIQNAQYPATLFSVSPTTFPGTSTGGTVTVVVKFTNGEKQTFTPNLTLQGTCKKPPPPDPLCPEGYTRVSFKDGILLCTKETVRTETVTKTEIVNHDVPGPTVYVDKPVEKIVEKIVEKEVPGPVKTITKIKTKIKTKIVNHFKIRTVLKCPIPKPHVLPPTR
jgi:hypothetical protein